MNRWVWFTLCVLLGLVAFLSGWLMPAHLRAVDVSVLQKAGEKGPALIEKGLSLVQEQKLGPAQLLLQAAQMEGVRGWDQLTSAVDELAKANPTLAAWGVPRPAIEALSGGAQSTNLQPITEFVVRLENRERILELLRASRRGQVQELLRCRGLTNTVIFPPSQSSSGQAFDAAISVCGLLLDAGEFSASLRDGISGLVAEVNRGANPERLEQVLMALMSLGQRFNWGQLAEFVARIDGIETLKLLANIMRKAEGKAPVLYSAVELSGQPAAVAGYLTNWSQTGLTDLGGALRFGGGAVNLLLERNQRMYSSSLRQQTARNSALAGYCGWAETFCASQPWVALALKWLLYVAAGFFTALGMHFARPPVSVLEEPLQVGGFHVAREILFGLGFLLVVLLLSEPFLAQESQKAEFTFKVRLPMVGKAAPTGSTSIKSSIMNERSLLTLLLFFVLQALIYTACIFKLAEIRRQRVPARTKLRLLENEEHLFDAGLYLGFAGTIISLILVSLGYIKPSLMAAYSSTSFGIIFVSVFKIFHLRPARRKILLEAETPMQVPGSVAQRPQFTAPL